MSLAARESRGIRAGRGRRRHFFQRADKELRAPPALDGSAMVARPSRPQIFAVISTAPACHDGRAAPGHSTSEMIQEDRKNIDPEQVHKLAG